MTLCVVQLGENCFNKYVVVINLLTETTNDIISLHHNTFVVSRLNILHVNCIL